MKNIDTLTFIISSGRSGTTLLRLMLNSGGELYFPHESDFVARAHPFFFKGNPILSSKIYPLIINFFRRSSQQNGWGLSERYLLKCLNNSNPRDFKSLIFEIINSYVKYIGVEVKRYGIKAPVLIANIDRILDVFPNAKIIHLVRDGRDVYLSYRALHKNRDVKSFGPNNVFTSALYWIDGLKRVEKYEKLIYEIRYEDLLNNPGEELKKICNYLDISYDSKMHSNFSSAQINKHSILKNHKETIHKKTVHGLDSKNYYKYEKLMNRHERFIFELIAFHYLIKYGYSIRYKKLDNLFFESIRRILYFFARFFNDWRYRHRDRKIYDIALKKLKY